MNTRQLTHTLRAQAEEIQGWTLPAFQSSTPPAPRRQKRRTALVVLASAVVVAATFLLPQLLDRAQVAPPPTGHAPTATPAVVPTTQSWTTVRCAPRPSGCGVPYELELRGHRYTSVSGGAAPTHHRGLRSTSLSYSRTHQDARWILVGAIGSRAGSRLSVRIGDRAPLALPSGRPSLIRLPEGLSGHVEIKVAETTRPLPLETLVIEEYEPLRSTDIGSTPRP